MIIALAVIAVAAGGSAGYFLLRVPLSGQRHPSWRVVEAPFEPWTSIRPSIWALAPDDVWIFGTTSPSLESSGIWRFDGREFSFVVGRPCFYCYSSCIRSENEIWLGCYDNGMCLYRWDGERWTKYVPVGKENHASELILGIDMLSHDEGWAIADFADYQLAYHDQHPYYHLQFAGSCFLHWDGKEWHVVPSPPVFLRAIDMLSPDEGWAVGDNILHWDGKEWRVVLNIYGDSIDMLSPDEGWMSGEIWDKGKILKCVLKYG